LSHRFVIPCSALLLLIACGAEDPLPTPSADAGEPTTASGGASGVGTGGGATGGAGVGGSAPTGGTASGGAPTGGLATGGASGGAPTGGVATGGVASGGTATGGTTTGGTATGGTPTGGTATGGEVNGGALAGGTGGEVVNPYGRGFLPTTITTEDANAAYQAWKTANLEDCGGGVHRVMWENAKKDATVSEGIGYGMLLAVSWNEREIFDGLLAYAKLMRVPIQGGPTDAPPSNNGLMNWLRYGCDAHRETKYSEYPDGAAADADLDVAMSLIMAQCRWGDGGYGSEATNVINSIRQNMFADDNGVAILQPGDGGWFDDWEIGMPTGCINYSYFAPGYYRAFAEHVPADADFWNDAANDAYTLLSRASNSNTGLVRNWGSSGGGDAVSDCYNAYNRASSYGDDAARTPWRIGTDYLWYGTSAAKQWTDKVTQWVKTVPVSNTVQWYNLDGSPDTEAGGYADHTVINVGPWAVGSMSLDQETVDEFAAEVIAIPAGPGTHEDEYFNRMLKALSLLTLSGGFTRCGGG
jgi:endo-1,4-beta-D-glucanase Y